MAYRTVRFGSPFDDDDRPTRKELTFDAHLTFLLLEQIAPSFVHQGDKIFLIQHAHNRAFNIDDHQTFQVSLPTEYQGILQRSIFGNRNQRRGHGLTDGAGPGIGLLLQGARDVAECQNADIRMFVPNQCRTVACLVQPGKRSTHGIRAVKPRESCKAKQLFDCAGFSQCMGIKIGHKIGIADNRLQLAVLVDQTYMINTGGITQGAQTINHRTAWMQTCKLWQINLA